MKLYKIRNKCLACGKVFTAPNGNKLYCPEHEGKKYR